MASGLTESADLIVEDGSGIEDANSYSDIATALAYINLRQSAKLTPFKSAIESNRVAALILASEYIDLRWRYEGVITFPGDDVTLPQALQWPRDGAVDDRGLIVADDELPLSLVNATIEYAARAINPTTFDAQSLLSDRPVDDDSGKFITEKTEVLGPLRETTKWSGSKGRTTWVDYGNADRIMRNSGLLATSGERLVRA